MIFINLLSKDMQKKFCNGCQVFLLLENFYPSKSKNGFGVAARCKKCSIISSQKQQEKYKSEDKDYLLLAEKRCYKCKNIKSIESFNKDSRAKDGYQTKCKDCCKEIFNEWYEKNIERERGRSRDWANKNRDRHNENSRKWRKENPERCIQSVRNWGKNNPAKVQEMSKARRARKSNSPVIDLTKDQWEYIKVLYKYCCVYCGKKQKRLTQDHIIPLVLGGEHSMTNIVPACRSCNSRKHVNPPPCPVQTIMKLDVRENEHKRHTS